MCLRSVVAGLPWDRSHKITVSSADPLANTFLSERRCEQIQLWYKIKNKDSFHNLLNIEHLTIIRCLLRFYVTSDYKKSTDLASLFQAKSSTASVWPSTGSAAAPWCQHKHTAATVLMTSNRAGNNAEEQAKGGCAWLSLTLFSLQQLLSTPAQRTLTFWQRWMTCSKK